MNDLSDKSVAEFADELADEALDQREQPSFGPSAVMSVS